VFLTYFYPFHLLCYNCGIQPDGQAGRQAIREQSTLIMLEEGARSSFLVRVFTNIKNVYNRE
jgi:hypothetical protein